MRPTKEERTLECILTDAEKLKYSKELGEKISHCNQLEASKKSYVTQINGEILTDEARIAILAEKVYSGREYRNVECDIIYDFERGERTWVRRDTGEIVKQDIIPEELMQEELIDK